MQTSARPASGLGLLDSYTPLGGNQTRLYYALREAVPIIDAAIFKTVRLTGGFEVRCADERLQDKLDNFVRNVPVGGNQCGLESFVSTYFEQLLTCGNSRMSDIAFDVGYQDSHYFSYLFKKHVGVSPREYRSRSEEG